MALILNSERNLDSYINNDNSIGQGQYEIENNFDKFNLNKNMVPFNTSEERLYNLNIENYNPGPGSYFKNIFYNKTINYKKIETTKDHIIKDFPMYNLMLTVKKRKINDLKCLKIDKSNKNQVIKYKLLNNNNAEQKKVSNKLLQLKKEEKDYSIPYKNTENIKGLKIEAVLKKNNKIFFDDKGQKIFKNKKEFLSSNISTNTSSNIYLNNKVTSSEENSKIMLSNNSCMSKTNIEKNRIKENLIFTKLKRKSVKFNSLNKNKTWNKIKNNFNENDITKKSAKYELRNYKNLFKSEPGPGYYSTGSPFDKYNILSKENKKYNFGSNQERDLLITTINKKIQKKNKEFDLKIENINKKNKTSFPNISQPKITIRNSLSTNDIIKKLLNMDLSEEINNSLTQYKKDISLGPGQYDIKSQFDMIKSKKYSFPLSKRFFEKKEKISPGPGAYLSLEKWDKDTNKNKKRRKIDEKIIIERKWPDMNSYSPHLINSIEYNNFIKNKMNYRKAPFGSSEEKLIKKYNSTPDIIGPGSYSFNKSRIEKKKRIKYIDKYEEKENKKEKIRILYKKTLQILKDCIGPGSYNNKYLYNDWHKKTFNIMYI